MIKEAFLGNRQCCRPSKIQARKPEIRLYLLALLGLALTFATTESWAQAANFPSILTNELNHTVLGSDARKVIIVVHGWQPCGGNGNAYAAPGSLYNLSQQLINQLSGSGWQLVLYHWEKDADTVVNRDFCVGGSLTGELDFPTATAAANNALAHGDKIAQLIEQQAPDVRQVHFIVHSAGTWAAYQATLDLLQALPFVTVQITLLDAFVPGDVPPYGSPLTTTLINNLATVPGSGRIFRLENYHGDLISDPAGIATDNTFNNWRAASDVNLTVSFNSNILTVPLDEEDCYGGHGGPIDFYTDTISTISSTPSYCLSRTEATLSDSKFDYYDYAWYKSLFYLTPRLPFIAINPQNPPVPSGSGVTLQVAASSYTPLSYQWIYNGQPIPGATGSSYSFIATSLTTGDYVVEVSNENGFVFSDKATVTIAASTAPTIGSVSPSALPGLPLPQTRLIRIIGSGYSSGSTLVFNDGFQNYNSDPSRLYYISANELDYYIAVGPNAGNWTVQVINGTQYSNLGTFTVAAQPPPSVGSLAVTLLPAGAVSAGAQWQVDGTGYNNSGQVVGYLMPGLHTVSFKSIAGYTAPASHSVSITGGSLTSDTDTYSVVAPTAYTLTLNYNNAQGGASASPLASGNTYTAGAVVQLYASAASGYHFTGWSGDLSGTANPDTIAMSGNKNITANFASGDPRLGTLVVTIQPPAAAAAGVQWGFSANDYRASGSGYTTFPASYFITLHPVAGWVGPTTVVATITAGQTTNITVTFTPDTTPGLLTVTLSPPSAASAGAAWHVNGGAAQGSEAMVSLTPGSYTVTFDSIPGWTAPPSQIVQVQLAQTTVVTGNYIPPVGQPTIFSIQPSVGALAGGTFLTIQGLNFTAPATVLVGGQLASNVVVVSDSQITCFTPSNSFYGTAPIIVQTAAGSATNLNGFAYGFPRGSGIQLAGSIGGYINAMAMQGNYGYSGEGSTFIVFDVSNPAAPTPVARLAMPGLVQDVALFSSSGRQYAAVADYDAGLQIVDITTPTTPALLGYYNTGDHASGVAVLGSNAYVANGNSGLMIFDISNPVQPQRVGSLSIGNSDRLVVLSSNSTVLTYVSAGGALAVVDVSNPNAPVLRGATAAITQSWESHSLAFLNNRVFLADGYGYLQAIDISNPATPTSLGAVSSDAPSAVTTLNGQIYTWGTLGLSIYNYPGGNSQRIGFASLGTGQFQGDTIAVLGGLALCTGGENGFRTYNVSNPSSPTFQGTFNATSGYYLGEAISGNVAFLATENNGLKLFSVSDPAAPSLLSQYVPSLNGGYGGEKVLASGNKAYFVSAHQINVLDVSNPQAPTLLGTDSTAQFLVDDIYLLGSSLVAAGFDTTTAPYTPAIAIFNVSNPASIGMQGKLDFSTHNGGAGTVAGNNSIACVAIPLATGSDSSLAVIDVTNLSSPQQIGQLPDIGIVSTMKLAPDNRYLYVGGQYGDLSWKIVDLANSNSPVLVSSNYVGAAVYGFDFSGSTAYLATGTGVLVYDVSNPSQPQLLRSYSTPTVANDVKIVSNTVYVADANGGFTILALSDIDYIPPVRQPTIISIQPSVGALAGGTFLTIQGLNFTATATVLVGGQLASNIVVVSDSQITCFTPSNSFYGTAPIIVQTAAGSATNLNGFAYGFPRGSGIQLAGSIGGYINAMAMQGNYGYSGEGSTFIVFDVSNPAAPTPIARLAMPGLVQDVAVFSANGRQYAAVANYDAGLQIVDITTPTAPALRGYYNTGDFASGIAVLGSNAFLANGNSGLMILDVSNPMQPQKIASLSVGSCDRLLVQTSGTNVFAYVSVGGALAVVDATAPNNPVLRGTTSPITQSWEAHSLAFLNNRVFFADGYTYLQAVDVSNPNAPAALGAVSSDAPSAVAATGGLIYTWATDGLQIYNFPGGPANRVGFASLGTGQIYGNTMCILNGIALCTGAENGFRVYDVSTPSSPTYRGAYGPTVGYYLVEAMNGSNAFVATQNSGLKIINVGNAAAPALLSQYVPSFNGGFGGEKVQVSGNRAYYLSTHQINVLDVSNLQAPALLGTNSTSQFLVDDLYVLGSSIVAAGFDTTTAPYSPALEVFDTSNPSSIHMQSKLDFATQNGAAWAVAGNSSIACVAVPLAAGSDFSLAVVNVSNLASVQQIGQLPDIGIVSTMKLSPDNRYLYVGGQYSDLSWKIIDLANSNSPVLMSSNYVGVAVYGFDFSGTTAFLATGSGVLVYDVSNPSQPLPLRSYSTPVIPQDIKVSGNNLYVADARGGLSILTLTDLNPPEVFITNPTSSSIYTNTTGTLNLSGAADDNLGLVTGAVTLVTWANNQGSGGTASGTTNWTVNGITLFPGTNILTVTASDTSGNSSNAVLTVIYQPPVQSQTIVFSAIADHTFGDPPIPLVASVSSGLPVTFNVISGLATVSNNVLVLTGAGAVTVEADQSGDASFGAATPVDISFNVARAGQSISFAPVPGQSADASPFSLTATASSGLPVYFSILSGPALLNSNVVTVLGAGTVTINAWQPGDSNYSPALTVQQSFAVVAVPQTISFGALSQQTMGDAPFPLTATASSGLPVNFAIVSGPATLSGNIVTLTGGGTVTVSASQPGDNIYAAATPVTQAFFVVPAVNPMANSQGVSLVPNMAQPWGSNGFNLVLQGPIGSNYVIEVSTNLLTNWQTLTNFTTATSPFYFSDPAAINFSQRFYRAGLSQGGGPLSGDSVGDGIPDWWRAQYFPGVPSNTTNSQSCATCDPDGDGIPNLQEYLAGTDPTNPSSAFRITSITQTGSSLLVTWNVVTNKTYVVQIATNGLGSGLSNSFNDLTSVAVPLAPAITQTNYTDVGAATNSPSRFYRIRLVP